MSRQRSETWWRMPPLRHDAKQRRGASLWRWAAPYWMGALTLAALLQLEVIDVKGWLARAPAVATDEAAEESSPAAPTPPAPPEVAEPAVAREGTTTLTNDPSATFASLGGFDDDDAPLLWDPEENELAALAPTAQGGTSANTTSAGNTPADAEPADPRIALRDASAPAPRTRRRARKKKAAPKKVDRRDKRTSSESRRRTAPTKKKTKKAVSRSAGKSCSAAIAAYRENVKMGDKSMPADITAARYGAVLNRGNYFSHCGVPEAMSIHICAAVQNGSAVGVTVTTSPGSASIASCIASSVRGLGFPSHPRMDVTRTTFK